MNARSWQEAIRMTQAEKVVNQTYKPSDYPDVIISRGSGFARASALNTITQKYNDPKKVSYFPIWN